jgi:hypothetical protein
MTRNPLLVRAYLKRGFGIWLASRAIVIATFLFAGEDPFHLPFLAELLLVAISVVLCFADIHRRRERAFLGNLGVRARDLVVLFLGPAMVGEVAFRTVVALF